MHKMMVSINQHSHMSVPIFLVVDGCDIERNYSRSTKFITVISVVLIVGVVSRLFGHKYLFLFFDGVYRQKDKTSKHHNHTFKKTSFTLFVSLTFFYDFDM